MPLAFPSHQGLILPLWRWFPRRIDGLALCVGAAMPDVVDAVAWPFRGELGQWLGHSLVGLLVCVPAGLALAWLVRRITPGGWISRLEGSPPAASGTLRASVSIAAGALSHVVFDLLTHANFLLLWPWYRNDHAFPEWWSRPWTRIELPFYREPYPIAPHTIAWFGMSILGVVLFVRYLRRRTG
jgi:hypothetical protein